MGRSRVHEVDAVLDAARSVILAGGVRAATAANISTASGAPIGSIYHAFGSRQGVLAATWTRATARSRQQWLAAAGSRGDDPVEAGVAMALTGPAFARREPDDVRVLAVLRPEDFPDVDFDRAEHNRPVRETVRALAARLSGPDAKLRAFLATVELPFGALRLRLSAKGELSIPPELDAYVARAARAILLDAQRPG